MKTKTAIVLFVILLFLKEEKLFSQNVAINTSDTAQLTATILDLSNSKSKSAFSERAKQKVYDFYNYLNLLSNPAYDAKLKDFAKKNAIALFSGAGCNVDGKKVEVILDSCMKQKTALSWGVSNLKVKKDFVEGAGQVYAGVLSATVSFNNAPAVLKEISIMIMLTTKQFGTRQEQVWTVFLCDIN